MPVVDPTEGPLGLEIDPLEFLEVVRVDRVDEEDDLLEEANRLTICLIVSKNFPAEYLSSQELISLSVLT